MSDTTQLEVQAIEGFLKKQSDLVYLNDFDEAFRGREQRLPNRELQNPIVAWLGSCTTYAEIISCSA